MHEQGLVKMFNKDGSSVEMIGAAARKADSER
jgi:diaminopimelate epimerase